MQLAETGGWPLVLSTESLLMKTNRIPAFLVALLANAAFLSDSAKGAVVLDLIGDVNAYTFGVQPTPGQMFTDFPTFNCTVLEDFAVSSSELVITRVSVLFQAQGGFASFRGVEGYELNLYSLPGQAGASLTGDVASQLVTAGATVTQVVDPGGSGEYGLVSLDVNIALPEAGTYWLGVSPRSAVAVTGQFLVANANASGTPTVGDGSAELANPGLGFGVGALSALDADYAYAITAIPEPGMFTLWLLGGAGFLLRRRPARQFSKSNPKSTIINHESLINNHES